MAGGGQKVTTKHFTAQMIYILNQAGCAINPMQYSMRLLFEYEDYYQQMMLRRAKAMKHKGKAGGISELEKIKDGMDTPHGGFW